MGGGIELDELNALTTRLTLKRVKVTAEDKNPKMFVEYSVNLEKSSCTKNLSSFYFAEK